MLCGCTRPSSWTTLSRWPLRVSPTAREAPAALLRGLVYSDGCVFVNRTGRYEYLSYQFHNLSKDILDIFEAACSALGIACRRYARQIRINRRDDAARLLPHIPPKA